MFMYVVLISMVPDNTGNYQPIPSNVWHALIGCFFIHIKLWWLWVQQRVALKEVYGIIIEAVVVQGTSIIFYLLFYASHSHLGHPLTFFALSAS